MTFMAEVEAWLSEHAPYALEGLRQAWKARCATTPDDELIELWATLRDAGGDIAQLEQRVMARLGNGYLDVHITAYNGTAPTVHATWCRQYGTMMGSRCAAKAGSYRALLGMILAYEDDADEADARRIASMHADSASATHPPR